MMPHPHRHHVHAHHDDGDGESVSLIAPAPIPEPESVGHGDGIGDVGAGAGSDVGVAGLGGVSVSKVGGPEHKASLLSSIANLANTIMGSGILALPFAFKSSGILLGCILLVCVASFQNYTVCLLRRTADITKQKTYGAVGLYVFGPKFGSVVDVMVSLQTFGVCVAYVVITGDLFPRLLSTWLGFGGDVTGSWVVSRDFIMAVFTFTVIFPLCLLKKMDSLRYTSYVAVVSIVYLTAYVVWRSDDLHLEDEPVVLAKDDWSVFLTVPIISLAYTCHFNWFEIRFELERPTKARQFAVIHTAFVVVSTLYLLVGAFGYITFFEGVHGNILVNYLENDLFVQLGRVGVTLTVVFSFPILAFSTREALLRLCFPREFGGGGYTSSVPIDSQVGVGVTITKEHASAFWRTTKRRWMSIMMSFIICSMAYVLALVLPDIAFILGLVGATSSTAICYIFPALFFLKMAHDMSTTSLLYSDDPDADETDSDADADADDTRADAYAENAIASGDEIEVDIGAGVHAPAPVTGVGAVSIESTHVHRSFKARWFGWLTPRRRSMRIHVVPSLVVMLLGTMFGVVGTYQTLASGQSLH